jgi:hypothetical protein
MSDFEWIQVDFQQFINQFGKDLIIDYAPVILYSKKDKEHEATTSLIAFFFISGLLLIYIALSYFLSTLFFNIIPITFIIIIGVIADCILIMNVIKSNVYIKPIECWIEIHSSSADSEFGYYCLTYYPIFTGKCHPNDAKNVILKMYLDQVLKNKIDITQIEIYFRTNKNENSIKEMIGYFFQYAEGYPFDEEKINRDNWRFYPYEKSQDDNFLATGNWDHQFEWRTDLEFDFDKLHEYGPWVIHRWNGANLKPINEEFKKSINWNLRSVETKPKLELWKENIDQQSYKNPLAYRDIEAVDKAIDKVMGKKIDIHKIRDIKDELPMFKSYFRDLAF